MAKKQPGLPEMMHGDWKPNRAGGFVLYGFHGEDEKPEHRRGKGIVALDRQVFHKTFLAHAERRWRTETQGVVDEKPDNEQAWAVMTYPASAWGEWRQMSYPDEETGQVEIALTLEGKEVYRCQVIGGMEVATPGPSGFTETPDEGGEDNAPLAE